MATLRRQFSQRLLRRPFFVAAFLLVFGFSRGCHNDAATKGFVVSVAARTTVNVFQPKRVENATTTSTFFGKLKANRSQTLGFPVGGSLATAPAIRQRFVSGETLATLDSSDLEDQLEQLQRESADASTVNSGNRRLRSPQDQIAELQKQILQRNLKAPFDCVVERTFAQPNSLVRANSPIVSVVETKTPKIEIALPRRIVTRIKNGLEYTFVLDGKNIQAVVRERAFTENPPGNIRVVFDIKTDLSDFELYLNQTVEARFSFPSEQSGFWFPFSCLQQASDGQWFVLAIESTGDQHTVRRQIVQLAQLRDDAALVTDELSEQFIVRDGIHRVVPGQQVELNLVELDTVPIETVQSPVPVDVDVDPDATP